MPGASAARAVLFDAPAVDSPPVAAAPATASVLACVESTDEASAVVVCRKGEPESPMSCRHRGDGRVVVSGPGEKGVGRGLFSRLVPLGRRSAWVLSRADLILPDLARG